MTSKHTPGPWKFEPGTGEVFRGADNVTLGLVFCEHTPTHAEFLANGRLFAAAPNMLAALELAQATIERLEARAKAPSAAGTLGVIRAVIGQVQGEV